MGLASEDAGRLCQRTRARMTQRAVDDVMRDNAEVFERVAEEAPKRD